MLLFITLFQCYRSLSKYNGKYIMNNEETRNIMMNDHYFNYLHDLDDGQFLDQYELWSQYDLDDFDVHQRIQSHV